MRFTLVFIALSALGLLPLNGCTFAAGAPASTDPANTGARTLAQAATRLRDAVRSRDPGKAEAASLELARYGNAALPVIKSMLGDRNDAVAQAAIRVLSAIPTGSATAALLDVVVNSSLSTSLRNAALSGLDNRPITRRLSGDEVASLAHMLDSGNATQAGAVARMLGSLSMNDPGQRAALIAGRFEKELKHPGASRPIRGSYLSMRVYILNLFLTAFRRVGNGAIPVLRAKAKLASDKERVWFRLALGMAGDQSVAPLLRRMIDTETDSSVRAAVVRAYAASAGIDAVPILRTLARRQASSAAAPSRPDPVALVAHDELYRLTHGKQ